MLGGLGQIRARIRWVDASILKLYNGPVTSLEPTTLNHFQESGCGVRLSGPGEQSHLMETMGSDGPELH